MASRNENEKLARLRKFLKTPNALLILLALVLVFVWLGADGIFQGEDAITQSEFPSGEAEDQIAPSPQNPTAGPSPQPVPTLSEEQIMILADLGRIAFTGSYEGRRDIWIINPDGKDEYNLTGDLPNVFAEAANWSPDGQLIAFDGLLDETSAHEVILVDLTAAQIELIPLTDHPAEDCYPDISPDGLRIIFKSERSGNRDLFVMNLDGSDIIQLTDHPADDYEPTWSPDGRQIAFVSRRSGDSEIFIMNADGSNLRKITDQRLLDWRPAWSPDGEWIAFETYRNGNADIYIMRPDGSDLLQLTDNAADDGHPSFSPDGQYLVFHSTRTGNYQLYMLDVDEPEIQWHIPTTSVRSLLPDWSPVIQ